MSSVEAFVKKYTRGLKILDPESKSDTADETAIVSLTSISPFVGMWLGVQFVAFHYRMKKIDDWLATNNWKWPNYPALAPRMIHVSALMTIPRKFISESFSIDFIYGNGVAEIKINDNAVYCDEEHKSVGFTILPTRSKFLAGNKWPTEFQEMEAFVFRCCNKTRETTVYENNDDQHTVTYKLKSNVEQVHVLGDMNKDEFNYACFLYNPILVDHFL